MRLGGAGPVALLCVVALAAPARAQTADASALEAAKRHFNRGSELYNANAPEEALAEFERAYALSRAPGLLFNMGQAARASRRWDLATHYYRAYLRAAPDAPEREYVEGQLAQISPIITGVPAPPRDAPPRSVAAAGAPRRDDDRGRGLRIGGIGAAAAGVLLAATAVWFGVRAGDAADDVSGAYRDGATYDAALAERYRIGRRDEKLAIATGIGGATLVAGGALLWYLGHREARRAELTVVPAPRGVAVGWSCVF